MQTSLKKPLVMATMASAAALMVACGGGDDSPAPTTPTTVTGKAVDFYLKGATVTFTSPTTACANKTTKTDDNGNFTFPAGCSSSALTVTGGTDIGTNLPFNGVLQSPAVTYKAGQTPVVSPLTTLAVALGVDASTLAKKLGVSTDPTLVDPMTDAAALKASVVVQQLIDQVSKTLAGVAASASGKIDPSVAAAAAAKAVAAAINNSSAPDLGSASLVTSVIQSAVVNAQSSLPASLQSNINAVAANVAAVAGPLVSQSVASVSSSMSNVTLGSSPADTLAALQKSGSVNSVVSSASSTLATTLVSAVTPAALGSTDATLISQLKALGNAIATGSAAEVQAAGAALGSAVSNLNQIVSAVTLKNYVQLGSIYINGGVAQSLTGNGATLTGSGALSDAKVVLTTVGSPFGTNGSNVRAGLHYSYKGNNVDLIIDNVKLTFANNVLTAATVPAGTAYNFSISGGITASVKSTNSTEDNLFSTVGGGSLELPVTTFLTKLKSTGALSATQITSLTPQPGSPTSVTFAMVGTAGNQVVVGMTTNASDPTAAKSTGSANVSVGTNSLSGNGVNFTLSLN